MSAAVASSTDNETSSHTADLIQPVNEAPAETITTPTPASPVSVAKLDTAIEEIRIAPTLPKVEFEPLEPAKLQPVIESAGMIWGNTDSEKHAQVKAQIDAEPRIVHPPREPKPAAELPAGPMVLIETGGKEQTIEKQN